MHPDLYAFVVRLRPEQGGPPPDAPGHHVQALFLELVRQVDPQLSNQLHAEAPGKPYTAAALPATAHTQRGDATLDLRITLLHADLFAPFTHALLRQTARPAMRLGRTALAITDVLGTPGSHPWAGFSAFADLAASCEPAALLTLEFATPTAIGQGALSDGRQRLALLPTPETLFCSLARRWNELAPASLELEIDMVRAACADTLISRYRLASDQINLGKGPQKGFVGTCTYELPTDPAQRRWLTLLADAAFYLGVGMKTARGMGLCRRIDKRQAPAAER